MTKVGCGFAQAGGVRGLGFGFVTGDGEGVGAVGVGGGGGADAPAAEQRLDPGEGLGETVWVTQAGLEELELVARGAGRRRGELDPDYRRGCLLGLEPGLHDSG